MFQETLGQKWTLGMVFEVTCLRWPARARSGASVLTRLMLLHTCWVASCLVEQGTGCWGQLLREQDFYPQCLYQQHHFRYSLGMGTLGQMYNYTTGILQHPVPPGFDQGTPSSNRTFITP